MFQGEFDFQDLFNVLFSKSKTSFLIRGRDEEKETVMIGNGILPEVFKKKLRLACRWFAVVQKLTVQVLSKGIKCRVSHRNAVWPLQFS